MQHLKDFLITEGKYGPTGNEADKKRNSSEVKKLQDILNKYFKRGKEELPKYFDKYMEEGELYIRFPEVWDGETRRLCRHLNYDDIFICIPKTSIYYVINSDELFGFEVTYGGSGPGTYVSGEKFQDRVNIFDSKSAKFFYELIKELNPETKVTIEDLEAN